MASESTRLHDYLKRNDALYALLKAARGFPFPYYIGAGCVAQTVWNLQSGLNPMHGINDVDFVYFDQDTSYEAENEVIEALKARFTAPPVPVDVKNQARVHLWYAARFGHDIKPYTSVEDAIRTWPTTASAVGVRLEGEALRVFAPFGLDDLFGQVVRPNKVQITEAVYRDKAEKWKSKWPTLTVVAW